MPQKKLDFRKIINRLIVFISLGIGALILFVLLTTDRSLLGYLNGLSFLHILIILVLLYMHWTLYALRVYFWSKFLNIFVLIIYRIEL